MANANSSGGNDVNGCKSYFTSNAIDYCHHFHGTISAWNSTGYDGYIPFNIVIDRDGKIRKVGHAATGADWSGLIEDLVGY